MRKFENLEEIAEKLGDGAPFNPNTIFKNVEEVVDAIVDLGNTEEVYARHDDHLGLKSNLSKEFLKVPLENLNEEFQEKFSNEIDKVLEQANKVIALSESNISESDDD